MKRNYDSEKSRVEETYQHMYENQTLKYVLHHQNRIKTCRFNDKDMTIRETLELLDHFVDESDPDISDSQTLHAYQTALAMRSLVNTTRSIKIRDLFSESDFQSLPEIVQKEYDELHLLSNLVDEELCEQLICIALVHDLGKILCLQPFNYPQWSVVGDTFVIGLPLPLHSPYADRFYHSTNKDLTNYCDFEYKIGRGFDSMTFSFGHDTYMADVLERSDTKLSPESIYIIRYHSLYCFHSPPDGQPRAYGKYASKKDWMNLPLLKLFSECDLYSKNSNLEAHEDIREELIAMAEKYIPTLKF